MTTFSFAHLGKLPLRGEKAPRASSAILEVARLDVDAVYARLATTARGLSSEEAAGRSEREGPNVVGRDRSPRLPRVLRHAFLNPLVVLLAALAAVSIASGDPRAATVMCAMILLGVVLKVVQEAKANAAAAKLAAMITVSATVVRDGAEREIPVAELVPGDVVRLAAGDMIPADVRVIRAKDLFVQQAALTGESFPIEKYDRVRGAWSDPLSAPTIAYCGTSVASGSATAVVTAIGADTYLGRMAGAMEAPAPPSAFDRDVAKFTWLMIRMMAVMVPLVFVLNGLTKGNWRDAFFFALAVAVGLTPEMLPMIVTVCLSKGAIVMSRKKVIVKRLNAIQNFGAMDVLCTDKTGTLTLDRVTLERYCDLSLRDDEEVLSLAYANSHFQTGLKSALDRAVLAHEDAHARAKIAETRKVDEIPFDFQRRIMSVVVRTPEGADRIVAKGAPEALIARCARYRLDGAERVLDEAAIADVSRAYRCLGEEGFRVLAVATKDGPPRTPSPLGETAYGPKDECDLVLRGFVAFVDPPKESAAAAIRELAALGVAVKVVTGDDERVARKVCRDVGIPTEHVLLGADLDGASDGEIIDRVERTTLFARVSPAHKQQIIEALRAKKHTIGFLGDGINDAPALHAADVGISVDSAVDVAKEAADVVLLEKSLSVLADGVREGRKVFANIVKYVRMGASSNFGNMLSVVGASLFLPFLPMAPIQILANNLLYDLGQTAIPTDDVDPELVARPTPWDMKSLTRFVALIGPLSSIFDYTTYALMWFAFGCANVSTPAAASASAARFQAGWFVESLLTQTLVIHVIRTRRIPFLESRASTAVIATSLLVAAAGVIVPGSPIGRSLGFGPLPILYWPCLAITLLAYGAITHWAKRRMSAHGWI